MVNIEKRFDIVVAIMTMSAFRSAPRKGKLNQVKRICGYLSAIQIHTEEPDYSDIPRTELLEVPVSSSSFPLNRD
jgi:hypothetical protein